MGAKEKGKRHQGPALGWSVTRVNRIGQFRGLASEVEEVAVVPEKVHPEGEKGQNYAEEAEYREDTRSKQSR